jgi:hypothetical protein
MKISERGHSLSHDDVKLPKNSKKLSNFTIKNRRLNSLVNIDFR